MIILFILAKLDLRFDTSLFSRVVNSFTYLVLKNEEYSLKMFFLTQAQTFCATPLLEFVSIRPVTNQFPLVESLTEVKIRLAKLGCESFQ